MGGRTSCRSFGKKAAGILDFEAKLEMGHPHNGLERMISERMICWEPAVPFQPLLPLRGGHDDDMSGFPLI